MQRRLIFFCLLVISFSSFAQSQMTAQEYAEKYAPLAIKDMQIYKIPASITLAQGIHESACGGSRLAIQANNHFGIKCKSDWTGETILHDDDATNECFRKYSSVEDSYNDHSVFLTTRDRYASLFQLDIMDYKGWANGLKAAGYATNPKYASILINIIETYKLYNYDKEAVTAEIIEVPEHKSEVVQSESIPIAKPIATRTGIMNGARYIIAHTGDSFTTLSFKTGISVPKLLSFNDLDYETTINDGAIIFTTRKKSYSESNSTHEVVSRCTLYDIAQLHGIRLKSLEKMNPGLENGILPIGAIIRLR